MIKIIRFSNRQFEINIMDFFHTNVLSITLGPSGNFPLKNALLYIVQIVYRMVLNIFLLSEWVVEMVVKN